ncbi:MAG: phosphotransferase [Anaerolineae bacterium]
MPDAIESVVRNLAFFTDKQVFEIMPVNDLTKLNAVVRTANASYFVKRRDPLRDRWHLVGLVNEYLALQTVALAGLGPRVYAYDEPSQCIVMECLSGTPFDVAGITSETNLPRVAEAMRQLHATPTNGASYPFEEVLSHYLAELDGHPLLQPAQAAEIRAVLARCEASRHARRTVLCHGDLASQNMFESDRIKFIDLEMAGANDLHFDLAAFIMFNGLSGEHEQEFLRCYGPVDMNRLADVKYAVSAREALWATSEIASGRVNDFYQYCVEYHFKQIAAMPR